MENDNKPFYFFEKLKNFLLINFSVYIFLSILSAIFINVLLGIFGCTCIIIALLIIFSKEFKEIQVSKNNEIVNIVFINYLGNKIARECIIDISKIVEYCEKDVGHDCYEMQFLTENQKDNIKILIQMSIYKDFRNYMLGIILDNNIKTDCKYL